MRLRRGLCRATQIGAEELDPESYRTSLELRAHLQEAARMRTGLETALRNLQNQLRTEDAEALERALQVRRARYRCPIGGRCAGGGAAAAGAHAEHACVYHWGLPREAP